MTRFSLSDQAWSDFRRDVWRQTPTVLRNPFGQSILAPDEVLATMKRLVGREKGPFSRFVFQAGNGVVQIGTKSLEPGDADVSLGGYGARLATALEGQPFGVVVTEFNSLFEWPIWSRFKGFLEGLFANLDAPRDFNEMVLFFGTYESGFRGVHLDAADVFAFVLSGRKRIRAWPYEVFKHLPADSGLSRKDYEPYLDRSICIEGEPGDILYWPARYWHVGESTGEETASLSLAMHHSDLAKRDARTFLVKRFDARFPPDDPDDRLRLRTPTPVEVVVDAVRETCGPFPFDEFRAHITRERLHRFSNFGLTSSTPLGPARLVRSEDRVRVQPACPLSLGRAGDVVVAAAAGRSVTFPASDALLEGLGRLNAGPFIRVGDLLDVCAPPAAGDATASSTVRRQVMQLLMVLAAAGLLESEPPVA